MAEEILTMERAMHSSYQYQLPEAHRREILARSPSSQLFRDIERQRHAFVRLHGDAFGIENSNPQ